VLAPGLLGRLYHLLRLLGRHRTLGDADLGDLVPLPLRLADRGVSDGRSDDGVRGDDGRSVSADPHRTAVVLLLADSVSQRAWALAELQVTAHLGRVRDRDVLHGFDRV